MPNAALESRGLLGRKGFPESYDRRALIRFLADVKSGREKVFAPVYDHQSYDIVPDRRQAVDRPDILVVEGLNVLQAGRRTDGTAPEVFLSDFFDFSVYVDAAEADIQRWYVERFLGLRRTAFQDTTRTSTASPTSPTSRPGRPPRASGRRSTGRTCAATSPPPGRGPGSSCRRPATTRCAGSSSASSDRRLAVRTCGDAARVTGRLGRTCRLLGVTW